MNQPPSKLPAGVHARGCHPASIATRFGRGRRPPRRAKRTLPEPPEPFEWKLMPDYLHDMMWVAIHDERWDTTQGRKCVRHWKNAAPLQFWRQLFESRRAWCLRYCGTWRAPSWKRYGW